MLLSDRDICAAIASGRIGLDPFDPALVQPSSVDVRLGPEFLMPPRAGVRRFPDDTFDVGVPAYLDPRAAADEHELVTVPDGKAYCLDPGEFVLASTAETVTLPADIAAEVMGKSSLARHGLIIESAGLVDAGFTGSITLELFNLAPRPILLWPGMAIGQVCFQAMSSPASNAYGSDGLGSRYQGQRGPTAARAAR